MFIQSLFTGSFSHVALNVLFGDFINDPLITIQIFIDVRVCVHTKVLWGLFFHPFYSDDHDWEFHCTDRVQFHCVLPAQPPNPQRRHPNPHPCSLKLGTFSGFCSQWSKSEVLSCSYSTHQLKVAFSETVSDQRVEAAHRGDIGVKTRKHPHRIWSLSPTSLIVAAVCVRFTAVKCFDASSDATLLLKSHAVQKQVSGVTETPFTLSHRNLKIILKLFFHITVV